MARRGRAGAGGRGARADLRERGRVGSRHRRLRGDGGAQRGRGRAPSSCCRASPRSRSAGCRTRTRRSTPTGARCATIRPTRTCSRTSSGWRPRPATGPSWRRCCEGEIEKVDEPRRAGRSAAAPRARLRGGDRPARRGDRDLPARRRRPSPTASRRSSRSIGCISARPAVGRAGRHRAPRDPARADRRGARRAHLPARRRSTSWRWSTCPRRSRSTARS